MQVVGLTIDILESLLELLCCLSSQLLLFHTLTVTIALLVCYLKGMHCCHTYSLSKSIVLVSGPNSPLAPLLDHLLLLHFILFLSKHLTLKLHFPLYISFSVILFMLCIIKLFII